MPADIFSGATGFTWSLAAWLLNYLLHSTILIGSIWLLARLQVVRSNLLLDRLWKLALVGGLLSATLTIAGGLSPMTGQVQFPPVSAQLTPATLAEGNATTVQIEGPVTLHPPARQTEARTSSGQSTVDWAGILVYLWLIGGILAGARHESVKMAFRRQMRGRTMIVAGPAFEMLDEISRAAGFRRPVRLSSSSRIAGPLALSGREICLPERALSGLEAEQLRSMLAHELAHIVRRDPAWLTLANLIESLLYVQPLNHLARRRMQEVAEYLCDDWAARHTGGNLNMARCLLEVAGWTAGARQTTPVPAMAADGSPLVRRVQRLLDETRTEPAERPRRWWLMLAGLPLLIGFATPSLTLDTRGAAGALAKTTPSSVEATRTPDAPSWLLDAATPVAPLLPPGKENPGDRESQISVSISGEVTYTADHMDIASISDNGKVEIEEKTTTGSKKLVIEPDGKGGLKHTYSVDGKEQPYDATAQAWLAGILPGVVDGPDFKPLDRPAVPDFPTPAAGAGSSTTFSLQSQAQDGTLRQITGTISGAVEFNAAQTDVASIDDGGSFSIAESSGAGKRALLAEPDGKGGLKRTYSVDGKVQAYDAAAEAWLAGILPDVLVEINREPGALPLFPHPLLPNPETGNV